MSDKCVTNWASSRTCELGTKTCIIHHGSSFAAPNGSEDWQRVTDDLPKLGDVCWLWDGKTIWLGGREMVDSDQWMWGNSYGHIWHNGVKWDADNETGDDYKPTHWLALPNPPNEKLTHEAGDQKL